MTRSQRSSGTSIVRLSLLVQCGFGVADTANAAICRVDIRGSGSGNSWPQPIGLQRALSSASFREIRVKSGTCVPGSLRSSGKTASNGGAMYNIGNGGTSRPLPSNVMFFGNVATFPGGAIFNSRVNAGSANPILKNVIAWGDTASSAGPEIHNDTGSTTTINDSVVQGGCPVGGATICVNVITTSPQLGALGDNGGFTQTHVPEAGSSALDAGNDSVCAAAPVNGVDQRGVLRPAGPHCDIGADEAGIDLIFRSGSDTP